MIYHLCLSIPSIFSTSKLFTCTVLQFCVDCEKKPSDILFVIDSSSSIWPPHFQDILKFTIKVLNLFDVSPNKTRIGVIIFSDDVSTVLHLDNLLNSTELKNTISNIHQLKGGTETGKALKHARENEFNEKYNRKTDASKVIILLTDGQSIRPEDTSVEAKKLKEENITVFVIGIGNRTDKRELSVVASSPRHQYNLQDYNALTTIKNMLVVKTCTGTYHPTTMICISSNYRFSFKSSV